MIEEGIKYAIYTVYGTFTFDTIEEAKAKATRYHIHRIYKITTERVKNDG